MQTSNEEKKSGSTTYATQEEWEAEGTRLFGEDMTHWRFRCPRCGIVMSVARVRNEPERFDREALRMRGYALEQECIGRYLPGIGCDWAAYGLFHGPVFVGPDKTPIFDFDRHTGPIAEGPEQPKAVQP